MSDTRDLRILNLGAGVQSSTVYRCTYCGQFYSTRTKHKHRACHMIEEKRIVEGEVSDE